MSSTPIRIALALMCAAAACSGERESPPHGATDASPAPAAGTVTADPAPAAFAPTQGGTAAAYPVVPPSSAAPPASPASSTGPRPKTKQDVIVLEGFSEPFDFTLFETPRGFALPFSTYVPADVLASGDASGVSFVANFAARRNGRVFLRLLPQPAGASESAARAAMAALVASRSGAHAARAPRRFRWSLAETAYSARGATGVAALGRHGGRYFIALLEYPEEFGEGFGPRVGHILQDLRWSDDGSALAPR